jgi:hypothetical protein
MGTDKKQRVVFPELAEKPVVVEFTAPDQSTDGGVLLIKRIDEKMGLTEKMAALIHDPRQPGKVDHTVLEMLRERVYGIACGYPDCNDATGLARDPAMQIACERRDELLASQPTLSRFENRATRTDLLRIGYAFTDTVIEHERKKRPRTDVRRITIDMDPTEDRTYGSQQLTFYRSYYDSWCYLPMVTTIQFGNEKEHHLVAPVLRPGNATANVGAITILKRLVPRLRAAFPKAKIFARLDGDFASPEVFDWLEANKIKYAVNMAKNSVLKGFAEPLMERVRPLTRASGCTEKEYGEAIYKAGKWSKSRRVVIKAEVTVLRGRTPRDNPRFVVTNIPWRPESAYRFYSLRGDAENRIRELKEGLRFDLTSCMSFLANQFRNLLTAFAYALMQQLRYEARGTECERSQVWILRERLLKVALTITESVRRLLAEAPRSYVWQRTWRLIALRAGGHG